MNRIFNLCLCVALGVMVTGQISTANAADPRYKGGGSPAAPRAAVAPHFAAQRMAAPRFAAPARAVARPSFAARRPATVNRSFARSSTVNRSFAARRPATVNRSFTRSSALYRSVATARTAATAARNRTALRANTRNRFGVNRGGIAGTNVRNTALTRSAAVNRANIGRLSRTATGRRQLARLNANVNRQNAGANAAGSALVNAGDPRRSLASNQFAYRSGNFQPGWDPGRSYYWHGRHWQCFNGIWAVVGIGLPYDWYGYPYPFCYDGIVYYDGDVCQPGGIAVSSTMVADVQSTLANDGYNPGPADGIDGPRTQNAIAQYQSDNGLPPNGMITEPLLESMGLA